MVANDALTAGVRAFLRMVPDMSERWLAPRREELRQHVFCSPYEVKNSSCDGYGFLWWLLDRVARASPGFGFLEPAEPAPAPHSPYQGCRWQLNDP